MDNQAKPSVGRLSSLCRELGNILGLTQGSISVQPKGTLNSGEVHFHHGKPQAVHLTKVLETEDSIVTIHDKSIKFEDEKKIG